MPVDVRERSHPSLPFVATACTSAASGGGFVHVNPRHELRFTSHGLSTPEAFLNLPGEVVSGHPDRHVLQVRLPANPGEQQVAYLKRQHYVPRFERTRNALSGFGFVSKSVREAVILQHLAGLRIECPEWLAYGESRDGRAFVLLANVAPFVELRELLSRAGIHDLDRSRLAERIGQYLAELHAAGIHHPDSTAKHCYVDPSSLAVGFIDWQSACFRRRISDKDSIRSLAAFHASTSERLASPSDRRRVLWSYRRTLRSTHLCQPLPRMRVTLPAIETLARKLQQRRSIREQRESQITPVPQRLIWLAGESVCVIPEIMPEWPIPADGPPFYVDSLPPGTSEMGRVPLAANREAVLIRRCSWSAFPRMAAWIRGRSWRADELRLARILFHLERHEVPAPRLLGFGQKRMTRGEIASFLMYEMPRKTLPLQEWLQSVRGLERRTRTLETAGLLIRQLHAAGCRIEARMCEEPLILVSKDRPLEPVMLGTVQPLRLVKSLTQRRRDSELRKLIGGPLAFLDAADRQSFLHGYHGGIDRES